MWAYLLRTANVIPSLKPETLRSPEKFQFSRCVEIATQAERSYTKKLRVILHTYAVITDHHIHPFKLNNLRQ